MPEFYAIPCSFEQLKYGKARKVSLDVSVRQHLEAILDTPAARCIYATAFGAPFSGLQYQNPHYRDSAQDWIVEQRKRIEKQLKVTMAAYEPRLNVAALRVDLKPPEVNIRKERSKAVRYRMLAVIQLRGTLINGDSFRFETEKKLQ